jgi:hypothetical protein
MREIRTYGSARGVPGNRHSYRNYAPHNIRTLAAHVYVQYRCVQDIECLNLIWSDLAQVQGVVAV